ncbi:DUF1579 domain-containing protein [Corallococcus aberystwythensis]|uniref:DUF1579 domain-containing protein n=2 Tax=Corallococcus aberystwythensis TaxID=2316722 RepID=A0A3A8PLD3_9BACT|nr:DUF1579 domain-containing protein [Corallococcus aberystwythensis]
MHMEPSREDRPPTQEPVPRLGPEQQRLEVFAGEWRAEGVLGEASGPHVGAQATAEEHYAWLPGGFFLGHRGVMRFGNERLESTRILGFDPVTQRYRMHQFDNMGYARVYEGGEQQDGVWFFAGPHERVTVTFGGGNHAMDIHWEQSDDGQRWRPLCDLKATRVQ